MEKTNPLTLRLEDMLGVADYYEHSMAQANVHEGIAGRQTVFDVMLRGLPKTKVVGEFDRNGVTYPELAQRNYMVLAGTEQALAYLEGAEITEELIDYFREVQGVTDENFLNTIKGAKFTGDVYGIPEGTLIFEHEPWLRLHDTFEVTQFFESLVLNTMNPQTNVATTANDIAEVANGKVLLEGGSRRAAGPQAALFASRAARIGGFTATSNVALGMAYGEKVGGTHGHSYVMLHDTEDAAFEAQVDLHGNNVTFLMDTYNVDHAADKVIELAKKYELGTFKVRIDSGDLAAQSVMLRERFEKAGLENFAIVASDDLTAGKIAEIEKRGAVDAYLVGTYVTNPPKPLGGVMKMCAYENGQGDWVATCKRSENLAKSTLPGVKDVYRVTGADGKYARDVIALVDEAITEYVNEGETVEKLTTQLIKNGEVVAPPPTLDEIAQRRKEQLAKLPDAVRYGNQRYEVVISDGVRALQKEVFEKYAA